MSKIFAQQAIEYPTVEDIIELSQDPGVNDGEKITFLGNGREKIEAAIARMKSVYFGVDLYPTLFDKAAVLLHSIATTHPFNNANKRIATFSALNFLEDNGIDPERVNWKEITNTVLAIVEGKITQEQLQEWVHKKFNPQYQK